MTNGKKKYPTMSAWAKDSAKLKVRKESLKEKVQSKKRFIRMVEKKALDTHFTRSQRTKMTQRLIEQSKKLGVLENQLERTTKDYKAMSKNLPKATYSNISKK